MNPTIDQLNALTNAGIISDNAVTWDDVAECDKVKALEWLRMNQWPEYLPSQEQEKNKDEQV